MYYVFESFYFYNTLQKIQVTFWKTAETRRIISVQPTEMKFYNTDNNNFDFYYYYFLINQIKATHVVNLICIK